MDERMNQERQGLYTSYRNVESRQTYLGHQRYLSLSLSGQYHKMAEYSIADIISLPSDAHASTWSRLERPCFWHLLVLAWKAFQPCNGLRDRGLTPTRRLQPCGLATLYLPLLWYPLEQQWYPWRQHLVWATASLISFLSVTFVFWRRCRILVSLIICTRPQPHKSFAHWARQKACW